jgi:cytoskeletal protein RodZ
MWCSIGTTTGREWQTKCLAASLQTGATQTNKRMVDNPTKSNDRCDRISVFSRQHACAALLLTSWGWWVVRMHAKQRRASDATQPLAAAPQTTGACTHARKKPKATKKTFLSDAGPSVGSHGTRRESWPFGTGTAMVTAAGVAQIWSSPPVSAHRVTRVVNQKVVIFYQKWDY